MDQDSSNGSGPDKRNWRERLGIGAKEMPRLSDEFREESAKAPAQQEPVSRPAAAGAQPVTRPAPMAPRVPRAPAGAPEGGAAPASAPRATPRGPDNAAQEVLAEKLRAQRAAAERLAEQRVQAARERAEGRPSAESSAPSSMRPGSSLARPQLPAGSSPRPRAPVPPPMGGRPKFSFAEEPGSGRELRTTGEPGSRPAAPPLTPPRPGMGSDRAPPPFLRPSSQGLGARPQPPYKPVDPAARYAAPPRLQPPPTARGGFGADPASPGYRGGPPRRPPALESFPRQETYQDAEADDARQPPRLGRPARARVPQEDYDEVFEDEAPPRPRASARDYQSAYGEPDDAFADDQRRSSGPWLLLLAILAVALLTGGGFWFYNTGMRDIAGTGGSTGEVPVVNAPEDPSKVAPEEPAGGYADPSNQKKQIYDRIVGDQEVIGGQVQPTEEVPVQPTAAEPADQVPLATDVNPIPAPDAPVQGTDSGGQPAVDEPPPLPLPPADGEQGSLGNQAVERIAAASAPPGQGALPAPPAPSIAPTSSSGSLLPPPPASATDGAALVSSTAETADIPAPKLEEPDPAVAATPKLEEPKPVVSAPTPPPPQPKPKQIAAKKKPAEKKLGSEPVVLVPPAEPVEDGTRTASSTPAIEPDVPATGTQPAKKRTIMDLFRGSGDENAAAAEPQVAAGTQVAAVEPPPEAKPARQQAEAPPATGSGFVVQLASFRTAADARKEYSRLSGLYPTVVGGLPEQIRETSVGGSTRYQLGLGPLSSRRDATRVCSALITAGESDCIVRGR